MPRTVVTDAEPEEKAVLKEEGDRGPKEIRKAGGMEKPLAKIEKTAPADVPVLAEISQKTDAIQKTAPVSATENSDASDGSAETMAFSTQAPEPMAALMPAGAPSMKMSAPIADTATVSSGPSDSYSGTGFANVGSVGLSASVRPDGLVDLDRDYSKWPETPCESGNCALSMENVPTDEELVGVTRKFAQDWNVDLSAYANPVADSSWKNSNADGTVPESVSVTYAKKTDGASDLVFSIDMRTKKVSSIRAIRER